ncbi:MAG: hypothetical protein ACRCZI_15300 [Cetobacterium sp.]
MTVIWPMQSLPPRHISVDPVYRSTSGGSALNGFSQVVASDAGVWKVNFSEVPINTQQGENRIAIWRGIGAQLQGRLNACLIECRDYGSYPLPEGFDPNFQWLFDDDTPFDDGTGFEDDVLVASVRFNAKARSSSLTINTNDITFAPGYRFSIGERLYEIREVEWQNSAGGKVKIWPPLRHDISAGDACEFYKLKLRVRLATDQEMELPLDFGRWSFPSVNFVEDV